MRRILASGLLGGALSVGLIIPALAAASVSHYDFYNCSGSGAPSSFTAVKTALPDAAAYPVSAAGAFRVVGSHSVFAVFDFGFGGAPGIDKSGVVTTTCLIDLPGHGTVEFQGIYLPGR